MFVEKIEKIISMSQAQFMKIITFEDFVNDYDTALKLDNNNH